jgi:hypothetical protein
LAVVAGSDLETRIPISVAVLPILVIEAVEVNFPHEAKDVGVAILVVVVILFGLSAGAALIFHYT